MAIESPYGEQPAEVHQNNDEITEVHQINDLTIEDQ